MTEKPDAVVTPGNHDGVHLGHRALLEAARASAGSSASPRRVVVLTFDPHPLAVLAPERAPASLTTLARRQELLMALGADEVVVRTFDAAFARLSPEAFVEGSLVRDLSARTVVIGPDFRFGRARAGDGGYLRTLGREHGFDVLEVPPVRVGDETVSSTRIRGLLEDGDVSRADQLLGRPHDVGARVVEGDGRGRTLGFRTANLACEPVLLPADGVYAVVVRVGEDAELLHGVANLGVRPTVGAGRSVEVHLLGVDADLYDRALRVAFVRRLRPERKFDGLEALKAQIAEDVGAAQRCLEDADPSRWRWI
ncbi:MAG: bifunctional riboflavin kinase/FAD synthetase [Sandaracinaceae bacterium]